jgi:hypothetical protein
MAYFGGQNQKALLISIRGQFGSGKTLLARNLIHELASEPDVVGRQKVKSQLICSSSDTQRYYNFLGTWRSALKQLLTLVSQRENRSRIAVIADLIRREGIQRFAKYAEMLCRLFGLEFEQLESDLNIKCEQVRELRSQSFFIEADNFPETDKNEMIAFCLAFLKQSFDSDEPFVIFFDKVQYASESGIKLIEQAQSECKNVVFVVLQSTNFHGQVLGSKLMSSLSYDEVIDVAEMNPHSLSELLVSYSEDYQNSFKEEARLMTEIKEPKTTIKKESDCQDWLTRLERDWQL